MFNKFISILKNTTSDFKRIPLDAKKYMYMHWFGGVFLIYLTILPVLMNRVGISLIEIGSLFALASFLDLILTYIMSKYFDKISPNKGIALDWLTEAIPPIIYAFATNVFHFALGNIFNKLTNVLNPLYKVYEDEIYPEAARNKIYTFHLITPEIFSLIFYPIIGFLLAYVFTELSHLRTLYIICGIGFLLTALVPIMFIKKINPILLPTKTIKKRIQIDPNLYIIFSADILLTFSLLIAPLFVTCYYILDDLHENIFYLILAIEVVPSFVAIITGVINNQLLNKVNELKIAKYGVLFFFFYALIMSNASSIWLIIIAYSLYSIGNTIWYPNHYSFLMRYVPKEKRGEVFGIMSSIRKFIAIITPLIAGFLSQYFFKLLPFILSSISFLAVFIIYILLSRKQIANVNSQ